MKTENIDKYDSMEFKFLPEESMSKKSMKL